MSGALGNLTPADVVDAIESLAKDVSVFAPAPVNLIASAVADSAMLVEKLLRARDAGVTADALGALLEKAMVTASDVAMNAELK
jgi:hypothetical protein